MNYRDICRHPVYFIGCGFGIGLLPWMPGTWATLAAVPLVIALSSLPILHYLLIVVAMIVAGIYLCGKTNRDLGYDDHPAVVWDEIATFPLAMLGIPITWYYLLTGFALFRIFDILKPGPIGYVDRHWHGGVGIMLDDVLAALATLGLLHSLHYVLTTSIR